MTDASLRDLAAEAGIATSWRDAFGAWHDVGPETLRHVLQALGLAAGSAAHIAESRQYLMARQEMAAPDPLVTAECGQPIALRLPAGRARLRLEDGSARDCAIITRDGLGLLPAIEQPGYHTLEAGGRVVTLAVAPARCRGPADIGADARFWGLAVQLYSLRGDQDCGLGTFTTLAEFAGAAGRAGADALAISPVHAQFSADPDRFTPYSPSSRTALNTLHADPDLLLGPDPAPPAPTPRIAWPSVARHQQARLSAAYAFLQANPGHPLAARLAAFAARADDALLQHARFEALHAHFYAQSPEFWHWRNWPAGFRDVGSQAVARFAAEHADTVMFHLFAQCLAEHGLAQAQQAARDAGMRIGLITDLAVGADGSGSAAWSRPDQTLLGLSIGAPPDQLNNLGQDWGLTAFSPIGLARNGYSAFLGMLRAALRHAGGVRIDHVMGLARLWVLPEGAGPREGAYLHYPMQDLLRLVALESHRHGAFVLGEDLGTLPDGYQHVLEARQVLGLRVLWFEQENGQFRPPQHWSRAAAAMTTTHDLATLSGWWTGRDLDVRRGIGLLGDDTGIWHAYENRARERGMLWHALHASGATDRAMPAPEDPAPMVDAAIRHVGKSACALALLPAEDALAMPEQPNLPGTTTEHANWCQRLPCDVTGFFADPAVGARLDALAETRRRP